jgi:membrane fusion protein, multidrug efflux system
MRIVPILTALVVMATLYLLVLEREALLDFAGGDRAALQRIALVQWAGERAGLDLAAPEAADAPGAANDRAEAETAEPAPAEPRAERRVAVVALASQARSIDRAVILRGRTEATRQVDVMAETSGRVVSEPLRRGAFVEAGDVLCELAPGTRAAALDEARARLIEAELGFRAAEQLSVEGFASQTRAAGARAACRRRRPPWPRPRRKSTG